DAARARPAALLVLREQLDHRQGERGRLASAGGGLREQIRARQDERDRRALDGRRLFVAERGDCLQEGVVETERVKPGRRRGLRGGRHPTIVSSGTSSEL